MKNTLQLSASSNDSSSEVFERRESQVRSYCRSYDVVFERSTGSLLHTEDGREFIDFLAGCSALNYGHNHPAMTQAIIDYVSSDGLAHALDMYTGAKRAFLEALEHRILEPRGLDYRVQFTGPTGTNAVEAALKLARKVTGRRNVVAFTNGFHGVSSGSLAATANAEQRMDATLSHPDITRVPYDGYGSTGIAQLDLLAHMLDDPSGGIPAPAAFIVETVQGEGGLAAASPAWLRRLATIAEANDALLIVDDIQAGCGRTGPFFSFENMGITPDMVTLSKSISGYGLPMALLLIKPELDDWAPAQHNGTFRGNSLAFVTAKVALDTFWATDELAATTASNSIVVEEALLAMASLVPGAKLKGRGMFRGVDLLDGKLASAVCQRAFEHGLVIETCGPRGEVVKVLAPLTTDVETLRRGLGILHRALVETLDHGASAGELIIDLSA